jgi:hypothetical protein
MVGFGTPPSAKGPSKFQGSKNMTNRNAEIVSALASFVVLWLGLAGFMRALVPAILDTGTLASVEGIATLIAVALWYAKTERWDSLQLLSPFGWLVMFVISLPISVLFVEIDCSGTLHFIAGSLTCTQYGGGISIVFTMSALALTAVALPSALRAWLLTKLATPAAIDQPRG